MTNVQPKLLADYRDEERAWIRPQAPGSGHRGEELQTLGRRVSYKTSRSRLAKYNFLSRWFG
jgi:hypothetical protein